MLKFINLFCTLAVAFACISSPAMAGDDVKKPEKTVTAVKLKTTKDVASHLQEVSATIHARGSQGSGVIKTRDGVNYVWTAGHVVAGLRNTRLVVDPRTGATKTVVEFDDAKVVKELIEDGRSVGRVEMDAEVLRYSDADNGEDIALLRVRKRDFVKASVRFYLGTEIPAPGFDLLHCGSLLGQVGSNSVTPGIVSQNGRVYAGKVYDQTTCNAFPGSSGGGVYLKESGEYCGMIVRGAGETFNLMVPVRRIREFSKRVKVEWALDDTVAVPADREIRSTPVEEIGANSHLDAAAKPKGELKFLINKMQDVLPLPKINVN